MIITDKNYIKDNIKKNQKLLGLDVSKNNIGLASSDINLNLAFPLHTIKRTKFKADMEKLKKTITNENIFGLVIGFPYDGDGSKNERTQSTKDFANELLKYIDIPIFFQDERFSTYAIKSTHSKERLKDVDAQAATWFLQIFIDKINFIYK